MSCEICSGKTIMRKCGSDTIITTIIVDDKLIVIFTYDDSIVVPSNIKIKMNFCYNCGRKLGEG